MSAQSPTPQPPSLQAPLPKPIGRVRRGVVVVLGLLTVLAVASLITVFALGTVHGFSIPATSMEPALRVGDVALADMTSYWSSEPQRGDVVVLRGPRDPSVRYVKRIVGLPGDRISFAGGVLMLNGIATRQDAVGTYAPTADAGRQSLPLRMALETLPNGRSYRILASPGGVGADTAEVVMPAAHYFVAGDNRDNSDDSRFRLGLIPRDHIEGRFRFIYWSRDRSRIFETVR